MEGRGTEGNRIFRVVGRAVKKIGKEDKMDTAEGCIVPGGFIPEWKIGLEKL